MPDRDAIVAAVHTHVVAESALDKNTWMALFAPDAVIEDPVGLIVTNGIDAIAADFWASVERAQPKLELLADVIVCGSEAAAILSAEINGPAQRVTIRPIVVNFQFNEAGKIARLRSFIDY